MFGEMSSQHSPVEHHLPYVTARNVLFNNAATHLRLYGIGHMIKDQLDNERKPTATTTTWASYSFQLAAMVILYAPSQSE